MRLRNGGMDAGQVLEYIAKRSPVFSANIPWLVQARLK